MKLKVLGIIAIILVSVLALGCVEESPSKAPATQTTTQATMQATQTPATPTELNLKIGEIAKSSKIEVNVITAQKVKSYTYYSGFGQNPELKDAKAEASPGWLYVLVDAEIKNIGSDSVFVGYTEFSIKDFFSEEGREDTFGPTMYYGTDAMERSKELYNNQKMKGKILFQIPENTQNVRLQYNFGNLSPEAKLASWSIE